MHGDNKATARVKLRTMGDFLKTRTGLTQLGVIDYGSQDSEELRQRAVKLALSCSRDGGIWRGLYSLLANNCEHFAVWCRTMRSEGDAIVSLQRVCECINSIALARGWKY
ncbi:hypothetical protein TSOC_002711 [Tetrabaena socialis]|uniref:LRAT domain-containing protein n=1 Tax=Tetrabaena socialis TaxID=47790 RepID=A0A2J8ADE1_9CHLO|nr:hypothetical protein TSOC_002711 [Tetrabaena socialis]|eukprot:PNH10538.1 hypothetical protein TSOC_002711 [Tetrabaena socialis]